VRFSVEGLLIFQFMETSSALDAQVRERLSELTAFERYAIRALLLKPTPFQPSVDLRKQNASGGDRQIAITVGETLGIVGPATVLPAIRPLLFGAGYKVLDQMVEAALEAAKLDPRDGRRWSMTEKVKHARTGNGTLPPLTSNSELWERLCALYAAFAEVRHSLVHRRIKVDPAGALIAADSEDDPLRPVSVDEQEHLAILVVELADAVLAGELQGRAFARAAWHLNGLGNYHELPPLPDGAAPTAVPLVIADLVDAGDNRWHLDRDALFAAAHNVFQQTSLFDAELHAGQNVFWCELDQVPPGIHTFSVEALPAWLHCDRLAPSAR
jgi:hypothetical protein